MRNAVASLEGSLGVVGDRLWFDVQPPVVQNTLVAGAIQNFEFAYELSVKMLRRQIELESDRPAEVDRTNFRDMLRLAGEKGLIADAIPMIRRRPGRSARTRPGSWKTRALY